MFNVFEIRCCHLISWMSCRESCHLTFCSCVWSNSTCVCFFASAPPFFYLLRYLVFQLWQALRYFWKTPNCYNSYKLKVFFSLADARIWPDAYERGHDTNANWPHQSPRLHGLLRNLPGEWRQPQSGHVQSLIYLHVLINRC